MAGPRLVSDLVRDSKLETEWLDSGLRHIFYDRGPSAKQRQVRREETWVRQELIGQGAYGSVYLERCQYGGRQKLRAVKMIKKSLSPGEELDHMRELEAVAKFSHPKYAHCFVQSYGWFELEDSIFISMEYLVNRDLQRYLTAPKKECEARQITSQVLEGLVFMHENGFVHRDIKPGNILVVSKDPEWFVKITDFGVSKRRQQDVTSLRTLNRGTFGFVAPEVLENSLDASYTFSIDMWSLGAVVYRILTNTIAFQNVIDLVKFTHGMSTFPTHALEDVAASDDARDFVLKLMKPHPSDRLSAESAARHSWFLDNTQNDSTANEIRSGDTTTNITSSPLDQYSNPESFASKTWSMDSSFLPSLGDTQNELPVNENQSGVAITDTKPLSLDQDSHPEQQRSAESAADDSWNLDNEQNNHALLAAESADHRCSDNIIEPQPDVATTNDTLSSPDQDSIFSHEDNGIASQTISITGDSANISSKHRSNDSPSESAEGVNEHQHDQVKPTHDEVDSIVSDDLDIGSDASFGRSSTELAAIHLLANYLAELGELVPLYKAALQVMGKERFANNFRRILKSYHIKLRAEACNEEERLTAIVLRKKTNRTSLAQKILQIVQGKTPQDPEIERRKEIHDSRMIVSSWLTNVTHHGEPFQNSHNNDHEDSQAEDIDDEDIDNEDIDNEDIDNEDIDDEDIDDEDIDDEDIEDDDYASDDSKNSTEISFPNIKPLEIFLRRGQPFRALMVDLGLLSLPGPLRDIINTVPRQSISLTSKEDISFFDAAKIYLEGYTGYRWDWWPLKPPGYDIKPENLRLQWILYGRFLQTEISKEQAASIREILNHMDDHPQQCHCCLAKPPFVNWSTVLSRVRYFTGIGYQNTDHRPTNNKPESRSEAAQKYTPSSTASSDASKMWSLPTLTSGKAGTGTMTDVPRDLNMANRDLPQRTLKVLFAVQGRRWSLELDEVLVSNNLTDSNFFRMVRDIHRNHRLGLFDLFSPFRFSNCKFVRFEKIQPNRIISKPKPALPDYDGYEIEYEYEPRPPIAKLPLIDQQQFEILLSECDHKCWWSILRWHDCIRLAPKSSFLKKIPKRNNDLSILHNESSDTAFGIEADYVIALRYLALYHIVPIVLAFGFWIYWLVMHPGDLQNASVPITTVLALTGTFWTLVGRRAGL